MENQIENLYEELKRIEDILVKADEKCPIATKDIGVNLQNREKAIKTAKYGPLNPEEENGDFWKEKMDRWDVSEGEAKKSLCGNCVMFIRTPNMLNCIEQGIESGDSSKNNAWDAIDKAELGYCEAFDFKCAASRTCDAWVVGGPITEDRKTEVKSLDEENLPKYDEYYFLSSKPINDKNALIEAKVAKYILKANMGSSNDIEEKSLDKWFDEKWVDISRPKSGGGFEPCGRDDAKSGKYPKCVPASKAANMTPKEIASAVRRKRKAESTQTRTDKKPIYVSTDKKTAEPSAIQEKAAIPTNPELYSRVKAEAKKKFDVYPSAYANAWLVREYKKRGGGYRTGEKNIIIDSETKSANSKKKLKNPKGGLTAAGRKYFKRTQGANLKPGVKGPADTPEKMRRKGSFLTRFFTNPAGPMKDEKGRPTRLALSAAAWGEPIPQNMESAAKLAEKGRNLLKRYDKTKNKK